MKKIILSSLIIIFTAAPAGAADFFYWRQISKDISKPYVLADDNEKLTIKADVDSLTNNTMIKVMNLVRQKQISKYFTIPENMTAGSDLYFIKFSGYNNSLFNKTPTITVKYEADNNYKELYYYDWSKLSFVKLNTVRDPLAKTLTFQMPDTEKLLFAVLNEPYIVGKASWYVYPKYKGELIAAARDFAKGTKLKLTNLYNNRQTVVSIEDYGPKLCADWTEKEQRLMGPCQERVLDLSKTAFLKLATTTGVGIISNLKVEPYNY